MKPEKCVNLNLDDYLKYGDRKVPGRISLLINTKDGFAYFVPRNIEHIDFARGIQKADNIELSSLVPIHIDTEPADGDRIITGLVTGISGMETGYGVRHYWNEIQTAHGIGKVLIKSAHLDSRNIINEDIVRRYIINIEHESSIRSSR